jgi:hypothetical protein
MAAKRRGPIVLMAAIGRNPEMALDEIMDAPIRADDNSPAVGSGRRQLFKRAGIGAAALGALSFGMPKVAEASTAIDDADILNFALNLEYLEAEYYLMAVHGHGLSHNDSTGNDGAPGYVNGGAKVQFKNKYVRQYAEEIAHDELNHVLFLRSALGSNAVSRPAINLNQSFTTLARAAGIVGPNDSFNPFLDDNSFLLGAFIFEDVGVTAYNGAGASITTPAYLTAATSILAVEAYHAASVRLQLLQQGLAEPANKISALRAALSAQVTAGAGDDQGITIHGHANIVPTDSNSLAFARTPAEVLNIVYGGGSGSNYLFYPNKMNGTIS